MQSLGTFDLALNFFILFVMPLLIVANLKGIGTQSPLGAYLWRENPNFMRVSLVILGLLTLNAAVTLLEHYGLVSEAFVNTANLVIGIPFLVMAIAVIWLGILALLQYWRTRGGTPG